MRQHDDAQKVSTAIEAAYRSGLNPLLASTPKPLPTKAFGLTFQNPVGLAAGMDKNGAHIDALFKAIDDIAAEARRKRLELEKLVKARKDTIRSDIVMDSAKALQDHIDQINGTLGGRIRLPRVPAAEGIYLDENGQIEGLF